MWCSLPGSPCTARGRRKPDRECNGTNCVRYHPKISTELHCGKKTNHELEKLSQFKAEVTGYDELAKPLVKLMYYTGGQKVLINDIVNDTMTALKRKQSKSSESIKAWFASRHRP